MTKKEFIELMDKAIEKYAILGDWVEDCQFPYQCHSDCHCQKTRETDKPDQKVTIEDLKEWKAIFLERGGEK